MGIEKNDSKNFSCFWLSAISLISFWQFRVFDTDSIHCNGTRTWCLVRETVDLKKLGSIRKRLDTLDNITWGIRPSQYWLNFMQKQLSKFLAVLSFALCLLPFDKYVVQHFTSLHFICPLFYIFIHSSIYLLCVYLFT